MRAQAAIIIIVEAKPAALHADGVTTQISGGGKRKKFFWERGNKGPKHAVIVITGSETEE